MSNRALHVGKTPESKRNYARYLDTLDYEPTINERFNFKQTSQTGEELAKDTSTKKRPKNVSDQIKDHISENWIGWIFVVVGCVLVYLLYDSKVAVIKIDTQISAQGTQIQELKKADDESRKLDQEQSIKIAETTMQISTIQKTIDELRTDLKDMFKNSTKMEDLKPQKIDPLPKQP